MPSRKQLEELLQSEPDDIFLRYALAMACVEERDISAGIAGFEEVIHRDPQYVPAWFQMGQVLAREDKIKESRAILTQGIEMARQTGDTHAEGEMTDFLASLGCD